MERDEIAAVAALLSYQLRRIRATRPFLPFGQAFHVLVLQSGPGGFPIRVPGVADLSQVCTSRSGMRLRTETDPEAQADRVPVHLDGQRAEEERR